MYVPEPNQKFPIYGINISINKVGNEELIKLIFIENHRGEVIIPPFTPQNQQNVVGNGSGTLRNTSGTSRNTSGTSRNTSSTLNNSTG